MSFIATSTPTSPEGTDVERRAPDDPAAPSPEQLAHLAAQLDAIRAEVLADLGERDADYIRRVVRLQRLLEIGGRGLLMVGFLPPAWLGGATALGLAKILENMEIGHNVMHGQYDWLGDPDLTGADYEWDTACPAEQWRHSHNEVHHTYTNVIGRDRDVGYGVLRMTDEKRWTPRDLGNPVYALALAALFQWGVALHDVEVDEVMRGRRSKEEARQLLDEVWAKARSQVLKDYVLFPVLAGPAAPFVLTGNVAANLARNLWSFSIIFCGHFPDGVATFTQADAEDESRGGWYHRQLLGSANITGGRLFHLLSGNLSHQIEHHLFPDLPAHRYAEIAPRVQEICAEHALPYTSGGFTSQLAEVARRIGSLALPGKEHEPVAERLGTLARRLNPLAA